MKRSILVLLSALLWSAPAAAGVPCSLPFNLQNGQPADATQVMANYNALVACLGNAAAAGVNSDITTLAGLTTPLSPSFGGTQTFVANVNSTGSANAQVVAATTPPWTALTRGYTVAFVAGFSNTGAMTLQVGASAATPVLRRSFSGALAMVGGEVAANTLTIATYDGTQFQLLSDMTRVPIGTVLETVSSAAAPGFVLMQGQCLSTTGVFNALWQVLGSPVPGACTAGNFPLPDGRGRVVAMVDSGGSGRITAAGGNFDGTVLYSAGGLQNHTMTVGELVAHQHSAFIRDPTHHHTAPVFAGGAGLQSGGVAGTISTSVTGDSSTGVRVNSASGGAGTDDVTAAAGSGTAFSVLPPILLLNRMVKY